jgi:hypothetical protein
VSQTPRHEEGEVDFHPSDQTSTDRSTAKWGAAGRDSSLEYAWWIIAATAGRRRLSILKQIDKIEIRKVLPLSEVCRDPLGLQREHCPLVNKILVSRLHVPGRETCEHNH